MSFDLTRVHKPKHRRVVTGPNVMTADERNALRKKIRREREEAEARLKALTEEATKSMKLDEDTPL